METKPKPNGQQQQNKTKDSFCSVSPDFPSPQNHGEPLYLLSGSLAWHGWCQAAHSKLELLPLPPFPSLAIFPHWSVFHGCVCLTDPLSCLLGPSTVAVVVVIATLSFCAPFLVSTPSRVSFPGPNSLLDQLSVSVCLGCL